MQENHFKEIKSVTALPEIMHFKPRGCGHLFTIAYSVSSTNDDTSKKLHLDNIRYAPYYARNAAIIILSSSIIGCLTETD